MPTNAPTLTFGATGFIAPNESLVLAGVVDDYQAAFSGQLNLDVANPESLTTPQGQLSTSTTAIIGNTNDLFVALTQQFDPAYATGRFQDAIGRYYFLERNGAQPTSVQATCGGATGTVIPVGALAVAEDDNVYVCTEAGTIPSGGTIVLTFACQTPGPIACPEGTLNQIYQVIPGWDSITNLADGVLGTNTESRQAFEIRREDSVAANAVTTLGSIIGQVAQVPGVLDYYGYDNGEPNSVTVGGQVILKNSIFICVAGGAPSAVAQAILNKKAPGCGYTGNTTETAYDSNPLFTAPIAYSVTYEIPTALAILFSVELFNNPGIPANAGTLIQNAIINAFAGGDGGPRARIGSTILATRYISPIAALGTWAQVLSLQLGSANTASAVFTATITGTTLTVVSLTSGTIAIGQTILDTIGELIVGTTILSGSGSTWTVSNSQSIGAAFTGNASGTNLTASAVTGTIVPGMVISGTGVPSGTTIASQTSGTTGGAGVYVTSASTTASSASIVAADPVTAVAVNQSSVVVQVNQVPTVSANDIVTTVS